MKTANIRAELEQFVQNWPLEGQYYIWGASNTAEYFLAEIGGVFSPAGFIDIDKEKWGIMFHGKPVISPMQGREILSSHKIIVTSLAYPEVREFLEQCEKKEFIDFCDSRYFLSAHSILKKNMLCLARTDLSVTEHCNLRCKHCNMLMPYFKHPVHRDLQELKEEVDVYFTWIDQVQTFDILGGEPFLYPYIAEFTQYLCEHYRSRIHQIVFFSNGLVLPPESQLALMREYQIKVQISDYRNGLPHLADKIDCFRGLLQKWDISTSRGVDEQWISFGFPDFHRPVDWGKDPIKFFDTCYAPFRGLHQKKLYYCHLEASAVAAGLFQPDSNDFFDLANYDESRKIELAGFDLGYTKRGDLSFCECCKGCFPVNQDFVPVAEQQKR